MKKYNIGDKLLIKGLNKVVTVKGIIKDKFYDFGLNEEGIQMIGEIAKDYDYQLYKPTILQRIRELLWKK